MASGIKDRVAILGMGCTRFGERWDASPEDLMVEAFGEALEDGRPLSDYKIWHESTLVGSFDRDIQVFVQYNLAHDHSSSDLDDIDRTTGARTLATAGKSMVAQPEKV